MNLTPEQISKLSYVLQISEKQLTKDIEGDPELLATLLRLLSK